MKAFTYNEDAKIKQGIDITAFKTDNTFTTKIAKTLSFRTYAPVAWDDAAIASALRSREPRDILLHMCVEFTNVHDDAGSSFLPATCFLLAIPLSCKPCIVDATTLPLTTNGKHVLYICYEGTTAINTQDVCIVNKKGVPEVRDKSDTPIVFSNDVNELHVFDF